MKKFLLSVFIAFSLIRANANPVMPHPIVITELHFNNNGDWVIEMKNGFDYFGWETNLDSIRFTTSSGSFYFKQGINLTSDQLFLVNNDSLTAPMTINRNNDFIRLEKNIGNIWTEIGISFDFGDNPNYDITPLDLNQSIELFQYSGSSMHEKNIYVKSTVSSLGVYPNPDLFNHSKGIFQGYVFDRYNNPISSRQTYIYYYPLTEGDLSIFYPNHQSGSYYREMYSRRYNVTIGINGFNYPRIDTIIIIEPGQITNCIFHLNCVNGINNMDKSTFSGISNYPNPASDHTNFTFTFPNPTSISKGVIKIYNSNGEIVKLLPVTSSVINENKYSILLDVKNDNAFTSGTYYYCLEINGKKICSNKMTIIK